jgi:hypothetical protein
VVAHGSHEATSLVPAVQRLWAHEPPEELVEVELLADVDELDELELPPPQ